MALTSTITSSKMLYHAVHLTVLLEHLCLLASPICQCLTPSSAHATVILEAVQGAGALEGAGDDPAAAETPTPGQQGAPSGSGGGDGGETSGADLGQAESGQPECSVSMEEGEELEVNLEGEITKDYYFQKYKTEWEHLPEFRGGPDNRFFCLEHA